MTALDETSKSAATEQVAVAVVGSGSTAEAYRRAVRNCGSTRLIELPVDRRVGDSLAAQLDASGAEASVLCESGPDAVPLAAAFADAGQHVLVGHGIRLDVARTRELVAAFRNAERELITHSLARFDDATVAVRASVQDGAVGRPIFARCSNATPLQAAAATDLLVALADALDLVTWWFDEKPSAIYAQGRHHDDDPRNAWSYVAARVEYEGGRSAVCAVGGVEPGSADTAEIFIQGNAGSIALAGADVGPQLIQPHGATTLSVGVDVLIARQVAAFAAAVRSRDESGQPSLGTDWRPVFDDAIRSSLASGGTFSFEDGARGDG